VPPGPTGRARKAEAGAEDPRRVGSHVGAAAGPLDGPGFEVGSTIATRAASGKVFAEMADKVPGFIGGAADLVESTKTAIDHKRLHHATDPGAGTSHFGIREHAMAAITNGLAVHGGLRPYAATFFQFSDYMRPAVRLGALMGAPSIWVWTHDSVFLGEDGPTHQPIEHLASLRAMPEPVGGPPADATETVEAWELALNRTDGPVGLVLTRQNLPVLDRPKGGVAKGGYVLRDGDDVVLIATGSEVALALEAADLLAGEGVSARVVSLPCWELFFAQDEAYRTEVLGESIPRVSIEAGATFGWERVVGWRGDDRHRPLRSVGPGGGPGRAVRVHALGGGPGTAGEVHERPMWTLRVGAPAQRPSRCAEAMSFSRQPRSARVQRLPVPHRVVAAKRVRLYLGLGNLKAKNASTALGLVVGASIPCCSEVSTSWCSGSSSSDRPAEFLAYLLSGMFVFHFTSQSLTGGANSILSERQAAREPPLSTPDPSDGERCSSREWDSSLRSGCSISSRFPSGEPPWAIRLIYLPLVVALHVLFNLGLACSRLDWRFRSVTSTT
jgi:transketolase C-terminal domain/subunit